MASCSGCHSAGTVDSGGSNLAGKGSLLVANLGTISGAMSGISLTTQEILDLQAFLGAVK
jgi:mono/diheme cytochrome c family protein